MPKALELSSILTVFLESDYLLNTLYCKCTLRIERFEDITQFFGVFEILEYLVFKVRRPKNPAREKKRYATR